MATEMNTKQVAKHHGISVHAVRRLVQRGQLVPVRREGLLTYWFLAADVRRIAKPRPAGRPHGAKDRRPRSRRTPGET